MQPRRRLACVTQVDIIVTSECTLPDTGKDDLPGKLQESNDTDTCHPTAQQFVHPTIERWVLRTYLRVGHSHEGDPCSRGGQADRDLGKFGYWMRSFTQYAYNDPSFRAV